MYLLVIAVITPPSLRGVNYKLSTAANDDIIWIDREYKFSNLPSFVNGATLFQVPHKSIPLGTVIEILVYNPSTIYIAHEGSARSGGFQSTLPDEGWILVTNQGTTRFTVQGTFQYIWKKHVTKIGLNTLSLPATTTSELVHSIFVQGNKLQFQLNSVIYKSNTWYKYVYHTQINVLF